MTRELIMLPEFDKQWKVMGFTVKNLKSLQEKLTLDSAKGVSMRGTGWLREIRMGVNEYGCLQKHYNRPK